MSKEMLFLCDVYTKWLEQNELPHRCASELLYGKDTMNKLRINSMHSESFMLSDLWTIWKHQT